MKKINLFCFLTLLLISSDAHSQNTFSVSDTIKTFTFPSSEYVFYSWIVLNNNTVSDLNLRWIRSYVDPLPVSWSTQVQVLGNIYPHAQDSSDFVLPAIAGYADYALIFFYPNNVVGDCRVKLKIYNPSVPSDTYDIIFHGITVSTTSSNLTHTKNELTVYPNPASSFVNLTHSFTETIQWRIIDTHSKIIDSGFLLPGNQKIPLIKNYADAMYTLELGTESKSNFYHEKLIIRNH